MSLSQIQHKLTPNQHSFFEDMGQYIGESLCFYGSILRSDYISAKSDIDVSIFSENEHSTLQKLGTFLDIQKSDFKKILRNVDGHVIHGYKTNYENESKHIIAEISLYNIKDKHYVMQEINIGYHMPFYSVMALYIVKVFYYNLQLISRQSYQACKQFIMHQNNKVRYIQIGEA